MEKFPETFAKINKEAIGEFVLQHSQNRWRAISWHPHYIMTEWVKERSQAIEDGCAAVKKYYRDYGKVVYS